MSLFDKWINDIIKGFVVFIKTLIFMSMSIRSVVRCGYHSTRKINLYRLKLNVCLLAKQKTHNYATLLELGIIQAVH